MMNQTMYSYADDKIPYSANSVDEVKGLLDTTTMSVIQWFNGN